MERNHTETSHVPFLSSQPGHILPHPLPCYSHYVFYLCRSRPRRNRISREHLAHAIIYLAGEALAGRYIGAKNQTGLRNTVHHLFYWGFGLSLVFTILYAAGGKEFLGLLTNDTSVISASDTYFYWALIIPLAGFSAFLWDGIFIGATATRQMLYSMLVASASFFGVYYAFHPLLGNHALWLAFLVYLSLRGIIQTPLGRQIMKKVIVSR